MYLLENVKGRVGAPGVIGRLEAHIAVLHGFLVFGVALSVFIACCLHPWPYVQTRENFVQKKTNLLRGAQSQFCMDAKREAKFVL